MYIRGDLFDRINFSHVMLPIKENFRFSTFFCCWSLSEMDVVSDSKDFLSDFVASLDTFREDGESEQGKVGCVSGGNNTDRVSTPPEVRGSSNVWSDIESAFHHWTDQILDSESRYEESRSYRESVEASLRRQQIDGFLNHQDVAELRYIADLWTNLLNCISSYKIGCEFVKRDIITYLLELHKVRQVTDSLFIETCLQL